MILRILVLTAFVFIGISSARGSNPRPFPRGPQVPRTPRAPRVPSFPKFPKSINA